MGLAQIHKRDQTRITIALSAVVSTGQPSLILNDTDSYELKEMKRLFTWAVH